MLVLGGCSESVAVDLTIVDGPRVLALAATPAEAAPAAQVELSALWVDIDGEHPEAALDWSSCIRRRSLAEVGPVAEACIADGGDGRVSLGRGPRAIATIPADACRLFGPDPPPSAPGEPQGRPADPDRTGGYDMPVLAEGPSGLVSLAVRLDCGVSGSTQAQAAELRRRHRDNVAPAIERVQRRSDGQQTWSDLEGPATIAARATMELRAHWPACSATPRCVDGQCTLDEDSAACPEDCPSGAGCGGAEWYTRFDPSALAIATSREAISAAWYATAGSFEDARTGRAADDETAWTANVWTAPEVGGTVWIWIVVRDDRGGVSWRALEVVVEP